MNTKSQKSEVRSQNRAVRWFGLLVLLSSGFAPLAADQASVCADRAAIERVYYNHRLGEKPPFEQVLPPATLENLVRQDMRKEAALKRAYRVEVTPALLDAEVRRINTTTRAPEILAEIKAALGNDPARFARAMAKPILVERLLREKFDNDDALHASPRREMEKVRTQLTNAAAAFRSRPGHEALAENAESGKRKSEMEQSLLTSAATNDLVGKLLALLKRVHSNEVTETTWQLGARPEEQPGGPTADEIEIKKRFGSNARILSSPHADAGNEQKFYFQDLPPELQKVLRVQLRQPGDVSAVIETPGGFLLYLAKEKTREALSVAALSLPKRDYQQWLGEQNSGTEK